MNLNLPPFWLNRTGQNAVKNIFFYWSNEENRMQLHDKVYWIYKIYSHENYFIDKVSMLHIYGQPQPASNFTVVSKVMVHLCEARHGSSVWSTSSIAAYNLHNGTKLRRGYSFSVNQFSQNGIFFHNGIWWFVTTTQWPIPIWNPFSVSRAPLNQLKQCIH